MYLLVTTQDGISVVCDKALDMFIDKVSHIGMGIGIIAGQDWFFWDSASWQGRGPQETERLKLMMGEGSC